ICLAAENETPDGLVLAPSFRSTFIRDCEKPDEIVVELVEPSVIRGSVRMEDGTPVAHATLIATPAVGSREDVAAIEDVIGRGPLDWDRFGVEDGIRELSGVRANTDASGAFSVRVNSRRSLVVRRIERWRRGDAKPIESFEPLDGG